MKIQNNTGALLTLGLGRRVGTELSAAQIKTVDDDPETVADAVEAAQRGLINIIEPPKGAQLNFLPAVPGVAIVLITTPADEETLVIGTETFEIDDDATFTDGSTQVDISASSSAIDIANSIKGLVNANAALAEAGITAREAIGGTAPATAAYLILEFPSTILPDDYTVTGSAGIAIAKAAPTSAQALGQWLTRKVATAAEHIVVSPFAAITDYLVLVQTTAGAYKGYDGTVKKSGGSLFLNSAGSVDIAPTDEIVILVFGF